MSATFIRRPPAPSPAERARTIAARHYPAVVLPTGLPGERIRPEFHHVHASGSVSILLPEDRPLPSGATVVELTDLAPVELREPVRGLLWITGWLDLLDGAEARAEALAIAEQRPDPRLLDLGHGMTMLRLTPASLVLADPEGTCSLRPQAFSAAEPDPFHRQESEWLRHLEHRHPDVVGQLARHLPEELRGGLIRPLGLDQFGLRLRVETDSGDHDVRLAFSRPVSDPPQLAVELRRLVGCPFLAAQRQG